MTISQKVAAIVSAAALSLSAEYVCAQPAPRVKTVQDLQYYTGPDADRKYHSFDLFLPEGRTNIPVLFFIHGGGWRAGDKKYEGIEHIVRICADLGMGVMSINYRLSPDHKHPTHIRDIARAFAWLYKEGNQYGIDRNRIYAAGGSAGGHLVSLLALAPQYLEEQGLSPKLIKGVMTFSGIYDLVNFPEPGLVPSRREQAFATDLETLKEASPLTYVGKSGRDTPPFLISYTDSDIFELDRQAQRLYAAFIRHRLPAELLLQPGRTHQTKTSGIANRGGGFTEDVLGPAIKRFLKTAGDGTFAASATAAWPPQARNGSTEKSSPQRSIRVLQDLQYYSGPGADPRFHAFDLYLPEKTANSPVLFFVHGGGWRGGDKAYDGLDRIVRICADLGMGVMSVNYRLSPAVKHPTHIEDVATAFDWLHSHAAQFGLDNTRVFVAGGSAGAHLAALLGSDPQYLQQHGLTLRDIKGVLAFSGVYDLANFPEPGVVPTRMEQGFGTTYDVLRGASPVAFIGKSRDIAPYLIAYTDHDIYGLNEQAQGLYALFLRHRLPAELVVQPGRTHETKTLGISSSLNGIDDVLGPAIRRFLSSVLKGTFADTAAAAWPTDQ